MKKHTIRRGSSEYHEQRDHDLFCAYKQAFTRKDLKEGQYVFESARFLSDGVRPAECSFHDSKGRKQLPVAWAYYDEIIKGIVPWMISGAESAAWTWWPDKTTTTD